MFVCRGGVRQGGREIISLYSCFYALLFFYAGKTLLLVWLACFFGIKARGRIYPETDNTYIIKLQLDIIRSCLNINPGGLFLCVNKVGKVIYGYFKGVTFICYSR